MTLTFTLRNREDPGDVVKVEEKRAKIRARRVAA